MADSRTEIPFLCYEICLKETRMLRGAQSEVSKILNGYENVYINIYFFLT